MDSKQYKEAAYKVIDQIAEYYDTLPERPVVAAVEPGYLAPQLPTSAPEDGQPWPEIQADVEKLIMPGLTHWQHPGFFAYFPANSSFPGMLGGMYSDAFTAAAFNWQCSPAITELETIMMDWLAQMLGLPDCFLSKGKGGGVIQTTASDAIATVMVVARERALSRASAGLDEGAAEDKKDSLRSKLVALSSSQTHSSTQKGAIIAGTKYKAIPVTREDKYALRGSSLKQELDRCKAVGLIPYYLTVSLGTTGTCAVDSFQEIADVLKEWPDIWVHVDAAYAGSALVLPEYQHLAKTFDHFDSFNVNMHKWMLTNFDCSCMFVRDRNDLISALSIMPSYLRNDYSDSGLVTDYRDWQIALGRRFRSLKVWFVIRSYGVKGIQTHIRNHIKLGELFHSLVLGRSDLFSILVEPAFALTVLTVRRPQSNEAVTQSDTNSSPEAERQALIDGNPFTKEVYERVNRKAEVFITSTLINEIYAIRIVNGSPNVEEKHIRRMFEILVETTEEVLRSSRT